MYWTLKAAPFDGQPAAPGWDGRYVLHRHRDAHGPHLDLRLEHGGCLLGWRIDADELAGACWATDKPPHPIAWLGHDGDAVRLDQGMYAWLERGEDGGTLVLQGANGCVQIEARRSPALAPAVVKALLDAAAAHRVAPDQTPALVADGMAARRRAIARLCGLGRELDGPAFDETLWRKALDGLELDEIHRHLRGFEVRFDRKYPPQPVSKPEPLPEDETRGADRFDAAMAILRA